jgi:hypothetical protein
MLTVKLADYAPVLATLAHPCWRKVSHQTWESAYEHIRRLQANGCDPDPARTNAYRCDGPNGCGAWHVGHR